MRFDRISLIVCCLVRAYPPKSLNSRPSGSQLLVSSYRDGAFLVLNLNIATTFKPSPLKEAPQKVREYAR